MCFQKQNKPPPESLKLLLSASSLHGIPLYSHGDSVFDFLIRCSDLPFKKRWPVYPPRFAVSARCALHDDVGSQTPNLSSTGGRKAATAGCDRGTHGTSTVYSQCSGAVQAFSFMNPAGLNKEIKFYGRRYCCCLCFMLQRQNNVLPVVRWCLRLGHPTLWFSKKRTRFSNKKYSSTIVLHVLPFPFFLRLRWFIVVLASSFVSCEPTSCARYAHIFRKIADAGLGVGGRADGPTVCKSYSHVYYRTSAIK